MPFLFLRIVLILKYYVLENITVFISVKYPPKCSLRPIFLIFCSITILNR